MTETIAAQAPIADTSEQFKLAFGHQPAGVAIITATDENGEPAGFTASSLTSVAAEPPISPSPSRQTAAPQQRSRLRPPFLVHMLDAENVTLAKNFATHDYPASTTPAPGNSSTPASPSSTAYAAYCAQPRSAALRQALHSSSPRRLKSSSATTAKAPRWSTTRVTSTRWATTRT